MRHDINSRLFYIISPYYWNSLITMGALIEKIKNIRSNMKHDINSMYFYVIFPYQYGFLWVKLLQNFENI